MVAASSKDDTRLFVYALCEPDGKTIRYIGVSANLWQRYRSHVTNPGIPAVKAWIDDLRSRGLVPSLIVLEEVIGLENGRTAEAKAIREYKDKLGSQLLNETYVGLDVPRDRHGRVAFDGRKQTLGAWAKELGISRQALHSRLQRHPVHVALSRGKEAGKSLTGIRAAQRTGTNPEPPPIVIGIDPRHCVKTGLTHDERRERREAIANAISSGAIVADVAKAYGVTTATVHEAIKEFIAVGT